MFDAQVSAEVCKKDKRTLENPYKAGVILFLIVLIDLLCDLIHASLDLFLRYEDAMKVIFYVIHGLFLQPGYNEMGTVYVVIVMGRGKTGKAVWEIGRILV